MLKQGWWPFGLLIGGAVILWLLGYRYTDTGAVTFMAVLIAAAGAYLIMAQNRGGWKR
jgi:hypothetical protein